MAIKSDYISGTLTITQGSTAFTGTGTGWRSAEFKEGDTLIDITGATEYMGVIEAITGEATGTLTKPWEGPSLVNVPYRMRYQPDGARSTAQARNLIEILGNGNITAFALLNGAANLLPMFTGPGAMTLITRQALVSGAAYDVQVATLADRAAYDGQDQGYAVLVSNIGDGRAAIYSKNSATSGDWSDPAYVTGAVGPVVQIVAGTTTTLPTGQNATLVVRPITDGYALDFGIPRGLTGADGEDGADGADGEVGATGPRGEGLQIGATGDLAGRDAYDNEAEGFSYVDVENGNLYFRMGAPGNWSDPIPFGKGDKGDPGDSGAVIVTTNGVGNGTAGPYTLNEAPASLSATWASISGVTQYDFTLSGNQITFGLPVLAGIPWQVKSSGVLSIVTPADGSVGASKINTAEAVGIRTAINAAAKPTTAIAGNLAVFDANREVQDTGISKSTTAQAQAGTNDTNYMTPLKTAQAILALSPPTDVSGLYSSVSILALSLADLQGSRLLMNGGVADPFDDETGINFGTPNGLDSNVRTLLHFDGENGSTTFTDSAFTPLPWVAIGNARISNAQSKFGGSSLESTGAAGTYAQLPDNSAIAVGSGNFTVDFWIRYKVAPVAGTTQYNMYSPNSGSATRMIIYVYQGILFFGVNGANQASTPSALSWNIDQWYHIAVVRNSGTVKMYRDGIEVATASGVNTAYASDTYRIGDTSNAFFDEFRLSAGIARWTSNFTPPTIPYSIGVGATENQVYEPTLDLYRPVQVGGLRLFPSATAATTGDTTFSSLTEYAPAGTFPAWHIADRALSSFYHSASEAGFPQWIRATSTVSKIAASYSMTSRASLPQQSPTAWILQGSNDNGATWVDLDTRSGQTVGDTVPATYTIANPASYTSYRIYFTAGQSATLSLSEWTLFAPSTFQNMTLVSVPYTATSSPTQGRLVVQIDTPLTVIANTDFEGAVSRDGGTTWINMPLTLTGTVGNVKTYESLSLVNFTGPVGSSLVFRVRNLTNKNIPVSGVVMQWK